MAVTMPIIDIIFKQLASSIKYRSERGYATLILRDDTNKTFDYKEYSLLNDVDKTDYSAVNYQYIKDIFTFSPYKVCVIRINSEVVAPEVLPTIADALAILVRNVKTGWITIANGSQEDFETLASWTKSQETLKKYYKSVCYKAANTDCKHIVNFYNEKVTFKDDRGEVTGEKYCPSIIGILASCNITRAATNYVCSNLSHVKEVDNNETAVASGKFILINDVDEVKVGLGINSLQTTNNETLTEDMKYIDIVESMDLIYDDINTAFKKYQGAYKNKYDNQVLFISAVNDYLKNVAREDVLDNEYDNKVEVNVDAQRAAWVEAGTTNAAEWDDTKVKNNTYKRSIFLMGDIKILGAMENLHLLFNMV